MQATWTEFLMVLAGGACLGLILASIIGARHRTTYEEAIYRRAGNTQTFIKESATISGEPNKKESRTLTIIE